MKVVIVGSGNVATVLGRNIRQAGAVIEQVVSKQLVNAQELARQLGAAATENINNINTEADLYMIAVPDDRIRAIADQLRLKHKLVVHTAGSVSIKVLQQTGGGYGILYPLQSLRKEMLYTPPMPVLIDGDTPGTIALLREFAAGWAHNVRIAGDDERLKTHVAAVITSNFTNHLYALTKSYCMAEGVDFTLLYPLISEIAGRLHTFSPADVQTGPAARGDMATIQKHKQLLAGYPDLEKVYSFMTESLLNFSTPG